VDRDEIERFIGGCLHEHGAWASPRVSDGVLAFDERASGLRGQIYEIDQSLHFFWIVRTGRSFRLYYDVIAATPRRARDAFELALAPDELEWRLIVAGALADGAPLPGSIVAVQASA
jgi:hypothetical protein